MALNIGDPAPDFELLTDEGQPLSLASLRGKRVVLFFYPKADTPGCTTEACEFRDAMPRFQGLDAIVLGISPDKPAAQAKFKKKYGLTYTLLCDTDQQVAEAYGVWKEKSMYGRKYFGIERSTFVVDAAGRIQAAFAKVTPAGHAAEIAAVLG